MTAHITNARGESIWISFPAVNCKATIARLNRIAKQHHGKAFPHNAPDTMRIHCGNPVGALAKINAALA